jgi:hypothetical protein
LKVRACSLNHNCLGRHPSSLERAIGASGFREGTTGTKSAGYSTRTGRTCNIKNAHPADSVPSHGTQVWGQLSGFSTMQLDADDIATRRMLGANDATALAPAKPERDWKRNVLIFGLGLLSWVATYVGMLELIEANMGDLPIIHRVIIGFSVAMLMTMIIWLLDQLFKPHPFTTKVFYAFGYVFLSLISIGFGFGFYWKVLESRGESSRSAESAVGQVQNSLHAASTRLEQLNATLVQLTGVSTAKAELERTKGTSCPNSKPGDGPRRHMREEDAQRFSFASEFVNGRVGAVKGDMTALNGDLAKIVSADASTFDVKTGTRNEFMKALGRKLDLTVTGFNAFRTDPQLRQIRTDLADRAERTTFGDPKSGAVSCPDPQLQMALRGVVKAIDQLPELEKPQIAAVEGSEATIEAFRRLTTTFYGMLAFKMPPSADELRDLQKKAVQSVESAAGQGAAARSAEISSEQGGLSKRDYVPLAVALFVDLCLFLVSMVQKSAGRLDSMLPKMQAAERGPVIQILSRFNEIHRDREIRENFEIFRHVVFDMNGDYYVAVPMDAPPKLNPQERENLRVEAQLLSNLFASFEKEKIFKRTMLPTNASIQKRLKRQGSKFAGSEAFRVYKFTDGAWSDIILGAVMGAAKRVEASGGRATETRRAGAPQGAPVQPTPPIPGQTMVGPAAGQPVPGPGFAPQGPPQQPQQASVMTATRRPAFAALRKSAVSIDPEHVSRFGPYAEVYQPQPVRTPPPYALAPQGPRVAWPLPPPLPEADVTVKAANANTQPVAAVREDTQTETIGVTLSRETATFSMPVSEAQLPSSLHAALAKVRDYAAPASLATETAVLNVEEIDDLETSDEPAASVTETELTAGDLALIGRMAPQAAE